MLGDRRTGKFSTSKTRTFAVLNLKALISMARIFHTPTYET